MKLVSTNVDLMEVFVIINQDGMRINADVNAKNWLKKEYVINDLFWILSTVNMNVIDHVMLKNIWIIKTVSVEKGYLKN